MRKQKYESLQLDQENMGSLEHHCRSADHTSKLLRPHLFKICLPAFWALKQIWVLYSTVTVFMGNLDQYNGPGETLCHKRKFLLTAYQDTANYFNQDPTGSQSLQALELPSGVAPEVISLNDCFTTCVDTEVCMPLWHCLGKS